MKPNAKRVLVFAISLLMVAGSFVGGAYWHAGYSFEMEKINFISDMYVQARSAELALEKLDKNEIAKGHHIIMSGLSVNILYLDDLINDEEDEEMKTRIRDLLQRIAENRDKFPEYYKVSDDQSEEMRDSISIVNETLLKYKK
jgi:hypothetical protein